MVASRRATYHKVVLRSTEKDMEIMETSEQKRKRQFDYMTSDILRAREKHLLAGQHFHAKGDQVFHISASITLIQALLATLAQAAIVTDVIQGWFNVAIALLSAFSVFWQSFAKHWDYSGRAGLHNSASSALTKIYSSALLRSREEKANVNGATAIDVDAATLLTKKDGDVAGSVDEEDVEDINKNSDNSFKTLTKQFEQATEGCTSQVPLQISSAFESLDARIGVCKREIFSSGNDCGLKVKWEKVYPSMYSILTATIISQPGWPRVVPKADKVVDLAMTKFLGLDAELLRSLLHRSRKIDNLYKEATESTPLVGSESYEGATETDSV